MQRARNLRTNLVEHPTPCTNTPTVLCHEICSGGTTLMKYVALAAAQ